MIASMKHPIPLSNSAFLVFLGFSLVLVQPICADDENPPGSNAPADSQSMPIPASQGSGTSDSSAMATFDGRKEALLNAFAGEGSDKFMRAECLFALGRKEEGLAEVNKGLDPLVPGNKINRWMHGGNTGFLAWPGIDCYIRFEKLLDAATKERYRKIYTGGVFYAKLSTSNHKIMAAMTRYLATQVWGADAFHADPYFMAEDPYIKEMTAKMKTPGAVWGTNFGPGDPTGEKYLHSIISATVKGGPGEFASRPYGAQNVLPLLTLADCAKDSTMAAQARIAYEVCFVQLAPAWLRGHLATFAPRSYPDTECQQPWGYATLPWLYFGGVVPGLPHAKAAASAAVSTYRIPALIVNAATDRSAPYSYRALINGWALNHYVNRTYALFSRSAKIGGRPWQGQSYPCGAMWEDPDPSKGSHLWITNPSEDEPGNMGNHTHGVRAFEQEILGRDSLLFVFQIGTDNQFPYALGYVPGGYLALINDSTAAGRIYLHYGDVLICVTASKPFEWNPSGGILAPASKPREGDSEFRVKAPACALAIETAQPGDFPGASPAEQLGKFRELLLAKSSLKLTGEKPASALYRNRLGDTLECTFDGPDLINGNMVDYKAWPVSESPWTSQKLPDGPLKVTDRKTVRTYDFLNWKIDEQTK
jgi:hypothetical protein